MGKPGLGVVVVTYKSSDVIAGCLESLIAASPGDLRIVVVDNDSGDDTVQTIRAWADGSRPYAPPAILGFALDPAPKPVPLVEGGPDLAPAAAPEGGRAVTLIHSGENLGFAGGVNIGLAHLAQFPEIGDFWVLNPDSMVPAASVAALLARLARHPRYALMGGRVAYLEEPGKIQIDGGLVDWRTGATINHHLGWKTATCPAPDPAGLDFIMGASMVASREFYETVGPMREDYFLYYEEVDWAMRRGDLPLAYCEGFVVHHWAGTSIGSPAFGRAASPFSLYFKHRGRLRFLRRFRPAALPLGYGYSLVKAAQVLWAGSPAGARAILSGSLGLPPARGLRARLSPGAAARVMGGAQDPQGAAR